MRYHAYQSKSIDQNLTLMYYAYCGDKGSNSRKFFYDPRMFKSHYTKELACKKCTKALIKLDVIDGKKGRN